MPSRPGISRSKQQRQSPARISHQTSDSPTLDDYLAQKALENPTSQNLTPQIIGHLQRKIGNHAVAQLVNSTKQTAPVIQRNPIKEKLTTYINDQGAHQKIKGLAAHLLAAMNAIDAKDWDEAYRLLYDKAIARQFGISLKSSLITISETPDKTRDQIEKEVNTQMEKGMRFEKKLVLPEVAVAPPMANPLDFKTAQNTDWLAMKVFPVLLEEWIHEFQHAIDGLLSDWTIAFSQSPEALQNKQQVEGRKWEMREADIYAIYKELGWVNVLEDFKSRYEERQKLDEYMIESEFTQALNRQFGTGMSDRLNRNYGRRGKSGK